MAGKKKSMDGGKFFELLGKKPKITEDHNKYLKEIKQLSQIYNKINESKISVNNLNSKVKSFTEFSKKNTINEHQTFLETLKLQLIEKIKLSLSNFISTKFIYDTTIPPSELLDNLLHQLKEFEKLLNLLRLLDNQIDISEYNWSIESFMNNIFRAYENYIENIFRNNPTINTLQKLFEQVQKYIRLYTEFIESMTNNRKINNPIYEIIQRLNILSDHISIKIQLLSDQGTNINGNQISNEMKRRIKRLYNANSYKKGENFNRIRMDLHKKYQNELHKYNLRELSILADIESKIESISRMQNGNNKNILLRDLRETIKQLKESLKNNKSLNKYPEFKEYEGLISKL
jgi:hypothetical protein